MMITGVLVARSGSGFYFLVFQLLYGFYFPPSSVVSRNGVEIVSVSNFLIFAQRPSVLGK